MEGSRVGNVLGGVSNRFVYWVREAGSNGLVSGCPTKSEDPM